jgi:hypothetical protein
MKVSGQGGGNWVDGRDISKGFGKLRYLASAHSLRGTMDQALWQATEALIDQVAPPDREGGGSRR